MTRATLTIEDIRDSSTKTGFRHVFFAKYGESNGLGRSGGLPYRADLRPGEPRNGPRRATAEEAAEDYCAFFNGASLPVKDKTIKTWGAPTVDMGNTVDHQPLPSDPAVKITRNDTYNGPTDVYDVLLYDEETGVVFRRKVGHTRAATRRYADLARTFGFSIAPVRSAVTYPTKQQAIDAEKVRIAAVERDNKNWRRVAEEAFAPVTERTVAP